jgi:hypothetical protein
VSRNYALIAGVVDSFKTLLTVWAKTRAGLSCRHFKQSVFNDQTAGSSSLGRLVRPLGVSHQKSFGDVIVAFRLLARKPATKERP